MTRQEFHKWFFEEKFKFDGAEEMYREFNKELKDAGCCSYIEVVEKYKKKLNEKFDELNK